MKKDNSANNFNYAGLSIDKIINNPDEYIVPECQEACKKFWNMNVGLSNICHTLLLNTLFEIPSMIHKLYNAVYSKYFSFGLFHPSGFIGKLLYSLDQCLNFSLKSSKLTNTL